MNLLEQTLHKDKFDKNNIRVGEQEKQYRYYVGDSHNILLYLKTVLGKSYSKKDVQEMQLQWINITEKIINQMAVVYLDPAVRTIMIDGKPDEEWTEYYLDIMPKNINTADKEAHRLAKLHNTSLPQVVFDEDTGRFIYKTNSSYLYNVKHEFGKLTELSYEKFFEDEWFKVYWTKDEHYRRDAVGNAKMPMPGAKGTDNPFDVIPFSVFRLKNSIDFWGEGQSDVVNVNEQVNLLLTKLINRDIIRGEGVMLAVNLELYKKGKEFEGEKKVRASVANPITIDNARIQDLAPPSLSYVGTNPQIEAVKDTIDWYIKMIANFNGLNPNAVLSQIKDTSDFQKIMDAVDQMEVRKDDVEPCRANEEERFGITKIMNNKLVDTSAGEGLKTIPEDATLFIDFADIEIQKTPQDLRDERDWRLQKNLISLVNIIKEENPDLTDEQAEEVLTKNRTANSTLSGTASPFELLTQKPAEPEE